MLAVSAAKCQVLSTGSPVDDGHRLASYDTSLVVRGGIDCGRRRRNIYDKKPRRYAKDDRTAYLIARNAKSVAYVTNNKNSTLRFVLLKLTTGRYEESHGLFATAELLVYLALATAGTVFVFGRVFLKMLRCYDILLSMVSMLLFQSTVKWSDS